MFSVNNKVKGQRTRRSLQSIERFAINIEKVVITIGYSDLLSPKILLLIDSTNQLLPGLSLDLFLNILQAMPATKEAPITPTAILA